MIDLQRIWPGWEIEELIGQGSYGKVYRIRREEMGERYYAALKVIEIPADRAELQNLVSMGMDNLSIRDYFEETARSITDEIRLMETLKSAPNVVYIEEHYLEERKDDVGWTILIRMELLESLTKYQRRAGMPDASETVKIGRDICDAISCCESRKIIHRDIKPDNIFRNDFGIYKLGDFGIARRMENTKSAYSQKGTGPYMAPEVSRGEKYDRTVDIYSLGIMLYQYLNRQRMPFVPTGTNRITPQMLEEAQYRRLSGEKLPPPCDAPPALAQVILKACDPEPGRRYQSAAEMKAALENWENVTVLPEEEKGGPAETAGEPLHWMSGGGNEAGIPRLESGTPPESETTPEPERETPPEREASLERKAPPKPERNRRGGSRLPILAGAAAVLLIVGIVAAMGGSGRGRSGSGSGTSGNGGAVQDAKTAGTAARVPAKETADAGSRAENVMSYEEYTAAPVGTEVTIDAFVQEKSLLMDGKVSLFLQDENGGYFVYAMDCPEEEYESILEGSRMLISGKKDEWHGEEEIVEAGFSLLEGNYIADPLDITASCCDVDELKKHRNEKFSMKNVLICPPDPANTDTSPVISGADGTGTPTDGGDLYFTGFRDGMLGFNVETDFSDSGSQLYRDVEALKIWDVCDVEGYICWYDFPEFRVTSVKPAENPDPVDTEEQKKWACDLLGIVDESIPEASSVPAEGAPRVSFHGSGADSGTMDDVYITEDQMRLPKCAFAHPGFTFTGWKLNNFQASRQTWFSAYSLTDDKDLIPDGDVVGPGRFRSDTSLRACWQIVPEEFETDASLKDRIEVRKVPARSGVHYVINYADVPVDVYVLQSYYDEKGTLLRQYGELTTAIPAGKPGLVLSNALSKMDGVKEIREETKLYVRASQYVPLEDRVSVDIVRDESGMSTVTVTNVGAEPIPYLTSSQVSLTEDGSHVEYGGTERVNNLDGTGASLEPGQSITYPVSKSWGDFEVFLGDERDYVMKGSLNWGTK